MKRNAKKSGPEVVKVNLVILNQLLKKLVSFKSSKCLMNTESVKSVEKSEVDKMDDNLVEVGEV